MNTKCFVIVAFIAALIGQETPSTAQRLVDPDKLTAPGEGFIQIITVSDGSMMIGRISEVDQETIDFATAYGILIIPKGMISSILTVPETSVKGGEYWFPDPNDSRLYFAPTGRMLSKGEGYVADYYLFFPTVNYGFKNNLSLGGGFSIFPTGNMKDQVYFITPKVGLKQSEKFNVAAGALVLKIPGFDDDDIDGDDDGAPLISVLYGVGTWGGTDRNLTVAIGYGMVDSDLADKPMVVIGGEQRLTRRLAFVTENWIIPGVDNALVSYGIRFLTEKFTTDFAFLNITGSEAVFPGIPYIDFVYHF